MIPPFPPPPLRHSPRRMFRPTRFRAGHDDDHAQPAASKAALPHLPTPPGSPSNPPRALGATCRQHGCSHPNPPPLAEATAEGPNKQRVTWSATAGRHGADSPRLTASAHGHGKDGRRAFVIHRTPGKTGQRQPRRLPRRGRRAQVAPTRGRDEGHRRAGYERRFVNRERLGCKPLDRERLRRSPAGRRRSRLVRCKAEYTEPGLPSRSRKGRVQC